MILSMPENPGLQASEFGLVSNSLSFTSPTTGAVQTRELPGARWFGSYVLPPMTPAQAAEWRSFLVRMRGAAGRAFGFDPDHKTPRGTANGFPVVLGGNQSGTTLKTSGWLASASGVLLPGDYLQVGLQLVMCVAQADSDVNQEADVQIEPPMRSSPADAAVIVVQKASCVMALDDATVRWAGDSSSNISLSFNMTEVFP